MRLRIRVMPNSKIILEGKRWHEFTWKGLRIEKVNTRGASSMGVFDLPRISMEAPNSIHYPLTWHDSQESALAVLCEVQSLLGKSKEQQ